MEIQNRDEIRDDGYLLTGFISNPRLFHILPRKKADQVRPVIIFKNNRTEVVTRYAGIDESKRLRRPSITGSAQFLNHLVKFLSKEVFMDIFDIQDSESDLTIFKEMHFLKDQEQMPVEISNPPEENTPFDPIEEKIEEIRVMVTDFNLFISRTGKELAERAIRLGLVLIELKYLVKMSDEKWEEWADENLPFIGKRNRQKYMLLAKREDCHPFTPLGVDRLEMLCSATKNLDVEDPIGSFLPKHEITVNETTELDVEEFKVQVDTALNKEKLEKRNVRINPEVIEAATREGKSFDKRLLNRLSNIAREGGDPEAYLKNPSSITEKKEESGPVVEDKTKGFISLSNKLIQVVDDIMNEPEQISKIDQTFLTKLIDKLIELQTAAEIKPETADMNREEAEAT